MPERLTMKASKDISNTVFDSVKLDRISGATGNFLGKNNPLVLAERLSQPRRIDDVVTDFDQGHTEVRDVARYTWAQRLAMLNLGRTTQRNHEIPVPTDVKSLETILHANTNFQDAMTVRDSLYQKSAGWNFSVNFQGFLNAGVRGSARIDENIRKVIEDLTGQLCHGRGVDALLQLGSSVKTDELTRNIWCLISNQYPVNMAYYLAERSQFSENYQREQFTKEMTDAKRATGALIDSFSVQYGLPASYRSRALNQLRRADFSAFDHLIFGIDSGDGTLGDYQTGTLRIETKLGGTVSKPAESLDALGTTTHELFHASSAQDITPGGIPSVGLKSGDHGIDANEGMTELLKKLSLGRVEKIDDRYEFYDRDTQGNRIQLNIYEPQAKSMFVLMRNKPHLFKALFHAYYGHIPDKQLLAIALDEFNKTMGLFS